MTKDEQGKLDTLIDFAKSTNQDVKSVRADVSSVKDGQADLRKSFELHVQSDDHVHKSLGGANEAQDARISHLESRADASGAHDITALEKKLDEEKAEKLRVKQEAKKEADKWRGRAWSIFAALLLATLTAFAGAYFGH